MPDIVIRRDGLAGRITLNRPAVLNALTYPMCVALDGALRDWQHDEAVRLVLIDAVGPRAFCAGGDIVRLYAEASGGNLAHGQQFWRDEYRMNARIAFFPKPVVSLMQGFAMGGGVGVGCHASHRVVGRSSHIALPECGIGLVPDVGGSFLLARAPGRLGEYLATTGSRMGPGDAIYAGFADHFVPESDWPALMAALAGGGITALAPFATQPPPGHLATLMPEIDRHFAGETFADIWRSLRGADSAFARETLAVLARVSPLAAACAVEMQHRLGGSPTLARALELEYRFTFRAQAQSDFLEGIRAAVIAKDHAPHWHHPDAAAVTTLDVAQMLMPLGADALRLED